MPSTSLQVCVCFEGSDSCLAYVMSQELRRTLESAKLQSEKTDRAVKSFLFRILQQFLFDYAYMLLFVLKRSKMTIM